MRFVDGTQSASESELLIETPSISQGGLDLRLEQAIDFLPGDSPAF